MPILNWIGREKVINHHLEVPVKILKHSYGIIETGKVEATTGSGNKVIHGDNLEALKALFPEYEGKIDCVYIDPPYNTGEENWVYNDNVSDPKVLKWLGSVVGKESEDLSRHDKWLCMMYPRLKLLQKLLKPEGFIAVSIDDNEVFNLGIIMNEIFGAKNRLACAPWRSEPSGGKDKAALRTGHEYILFYHNGDEKGMSKEEKSVGELNQTDKFGKFRKGRELSKWGSESLKEDREDMWYPLFAPDGSEVYPVRNDGKEGRWRWGKGNPKIKQILEDPEHAHWELRKYDQGISVNGKTERWFPFEKIRTKSKVFGWNTWLDAYGHNADGTKVIKDIFSDKIFSTPKPVSLIEWIISLCNNENAIILDSFAGSATTAHAVLNLNKDDGGNRKFILVEMEDYANTLTVERVRRVISGYEDVQGTGGAFDFYTLGEAIFTEDGDLNPKISLGELRNYIWHTETGEALEEIENKNHSSFLGIKNNTAYYFNYVPDGETVVNREFLRTMKEKAENFIIYAHKCLLSEETLRLNNMIFKKIPRDITKY